MTTADVFPHADTRRKLPPGWRWRRLGEVGHFESGGTPPKENPNYWGGRIPFVTGADITEFTISAEHARTFLTEAGLASGRTAVCNPGTVLIVTRTRVGRAAITAETMGASQDLTPYICGPEIDPEYACRYLLSISDFLLARCRGSTVQGLTREFVDALEIPLPPLQEQKRITAILNKQMVAVERGRAATEAQLETAKSVPGAYLRAAFDSPKVKAWPSERLGDILRLRKEVVHPRDNPKGRARFVGLEHIESGTGLRTGSVEIEMAELTGRKPRFYGRHCVWVSSALSEQSVDR
ncbi:MAG: restriction endonuclease subunit S [Candidatus Methylomirabilales bacterium]